MKATVPLIMILVAVLTLIGCLSTPTPPSTLPTPVPAGAPTIELADTPTLEPLNTSTLAQDSTPTPQVVESPSGRTYRQYDQPPLMTINPDSAYTATLITNLGNITMELFASEVPITVNNFVFLAREGFYDGITFHRVINGFMIQTGDPLGDGTGGPGYQFDDEPVSRSYTPGMVAMARKNDR
jgi:hypothetical protein